MVLVLRWLEVADVVIFEVDAHPVDVPLNLLFSPSG
jgi:hypothetical protein